LGLGWFYLPVDSTKKIPYLCPKFISLNDYIMEIIYRLEEAELDIRVIRAIKSAFRGQKLTISIKVEAAAEPLEEKAALRHDFEQKIEASANADHQYVFSLSEFKNYMDLTLAGKKVDLERYRQPAN
jgi:hypothetical protein